MLDSLRNLINSWFSKVLLGILVLCFAILWGAPQLNHIQGNGILKFGNTTLTYDNALMSEGDTLFRASVLTNNLSQGLIAKEQYISIQGSIYAQRPLQYFFPIGIRLLNEVVLIETADQFKLGASKDAIRNEINNDPFFKGQNNLFDPEYFRIFEMALQRQYGPSVTSENILDYFVYYTKREQILSAMSGNAKLPNVFYDAFNQYQSETRTIDYITITPDIIGNLSISNDDLAKWFEDNKDSYLSPEYREVSFITLTPEKLSNPADIKKIHDEIDTLWFNGSELSEIAQNYDINVQTVVFDANGLTTDGKKIEGLPQNQLIPLSFNANIGFHETPITIPQNGGYIWYQVDKIIEPRSKTLAEIHDKALSDWKAQEIQNRINQKAKAIEKDIVLNGKTLAQIASENGGKKNTQTGLQRGKQTNDFSSAALIAFFNGPKGLTAITTGSKPTEYIVFEVSDVTYPEKEQTSSLPDNLKDVMNTALQYDINNAFIQGRMEEKGGIKILNQQLFQQLIQGQNNG